MLLLCLMWWAGVTGYIFYLWICYSKKGVLGESWNAVSGIQAEDVKWYIRRKSYCQFFLKDKSMLIVNLQGIAPDEEDFLDLKLSTVNTLGKRKYRLTAGIFLAAITLYGGFFVVNSAIPYHGKLSWYLQDMRNKKSVALVHGNIYESGIEGILKDIREKAALPEKLCLATSFNLHFAPDGTVQTLDTMLYGFDENGDFTDSYLITYNAARSGRIDIYQGGAGAAAFDIDKDIQPLIEAVSVMPLKDTVAEWEGQECFGILYYGTREWYSPEGIRYLNHKGESRIPSPEEYYFSGYSVSVFCPENETLVPVRYLYMGYQDFPKEKEGYTADYDPEGLSDYRAENETDTVSGQKVHATGNIWRDCTDYPLEQYGEIQKTEGTYADRNGEVIYKYRYEDFHMKEDQPDAQKINAFLEKKKAETVEEWLTHGQELSENCTMAEDYYLRNNPTDSLRFERLTYLEGDYCSLVFFGQNYAGGVGAFSYLRTYTINRNTGDEMTLQEIAPNVTEEEWIELINRAFEKEQGFRTLLPGTAQEETAGEVWYCSDREKEGWRDGFYLTKDGIAFYYSLSHIAWEGEGWIEAVVPWRDIFTNGKKLPQSYTKYAEVLRKIMTEHTDQNGKAYDADEQAIFENNAFAVLDVDGDGREELIFRFTTSVLGGMCEVIYDYDAETDTLREELSEWVSTTYYWNGLIKVEDSHNHGKDPEGKGIWPYSVYWYDADSDSYRLQYHVTSWDGQVNTENFPDELDTDGDGILYYILEEGKTTEDAGVQPMNRQEYDDWVKKTLPEACVMDVFYHPMTEKSIESVCGE